MAPVALAHSPALTNGSKYPAKLVPSSINGANGHTSAATTTTTDASSATRSTPTAQIWRPTEIKNAPQRTSFSFDSMEDALAAFAAGEFLVVMDDENRENEGDLIIAASQCTTEKMAWMIKHTRYVESASVHHPYPYSGFFFLDPALFY
ncbi:hypothetical protein H1R20_g16515, partial [Candolleomyces eurysporus]